MYQVAVETLLIYRALAKGREGEDCKIFIQIPKTSLYLYYVCLEECSQPHSKDIVAIVILGP